MAEKEENLSEKHKVRDGVINGTYKATHYSSYHSYRRSMKFITSFVVIGLLFVLLSLYPNLTIKGVCLNISILFFFMYLICYYWVTAKSKSMKDDSKEAMTQMALNGVVSKSWHIYDGIYGETNTISLEISFSTEKSYLGNIIKLVRGDEATIPLEDDDIKNLRHYLYGLSLIDPKIGKYVAYATMTDKMANNLARRGIELTEIDRKYISKPGRWDYAADTGRLSNALWNYPRDFSAFIMSVDPDQEKQRRKDEFENKQKAKEEAKKRMKLNKLM